MQEIYRLLFAKRLIIFPSLPLASACKREIIKFRMQRLLNFVGIETSAAAITFVMFELSINEDIQKKARESIKEVLKNHDGCVNHEALNELHYLQQCINGNFTLLFPLLLTYFINHLRCIYRSGS